MKNTLAENMLRFGVKNLKESDVKRIEESLLTEGEIDLMSMPEVAAATKFFKEAWIKQLPQPNYVLGEYYLKTYAPRKAGDYRYMGKVIGFKSANFRGEIIPIPDTTIGGVWSFEGDVTAAGSGLKPFTFSKLNWDTYPLQIDTRIDAQTAAGTINDAFNEIPFPYLQKMYEVSKGKPNFDKQIATFKNKIIAKSSTIPFAKNIAPLLSGNAKRFYGV